MVSENLVRLGMRLLAYLPLNLVDKLIVFLGNLKHGDLSKYGITRPKQGPFLLKKETGRSAVIDVGTVAKIKAGDIQVYMHTATSLSACIKVHNQWQKNKNQSSNSCMQLILPHFYLFIYDDNNILEIFSTLHNQVICFYQ